MNYRVVLKLLGNVLKYEIFLLIIPLLVALYYGDGDALSFLITMGLMFTGLSLSFKSITKTLSKFNSKGVVKAKAWQFNC
mgnify:CR=1 FL=1